METEKIVTKEDLKEAEREKRRWIREEWKRLRDMTKCPDCNFIQKKPKASLDDCENPEGCDTYVLMYRGKLTWTNPNWDSS